METILCIFENHIDAHRIVQQFILGVDAPNSTFVLRNIDNGDGTYPPKETQVSVQGSIDPMTLQDWSIKLSGKVIDCLIEVKQGERKELQKNLAELEQNLRDCGADLNPKCSQCLDDSINKCKGCEARLCGNHSWVREGGQYCASCNDAETRKVGDHA